MQCKTRKEFSSSFKGDEFALGQLSHPTVGLPFALEHLPKYQVRASLVACYVLILVSTLINSFMRILHTEKMFR